MKSVGANEHTSMAVCRLRLTGRNDAKNSRSSLARQTALVVDCSILPVGSINT